MSKYKVVMIIGSEVAPMTYSERNRAANKEWGAYRIREGLGYRSIKARCIYVDHHINAGGGQYSLAILNKGHSERSREVAQRYVTNCCVGLGTTKPWDGDGPNDGVWVKDGTVKHTEMPAFVGEPLFIDNHSHQKILTNQAGLELLGSILANTITEMYPNGALVILSPGHGWYTDNKYSPGALMRGPSPGTEMVCNEDGVETEVAILGPLLGEEHAYSLSILTECRQILEAV